MTDIPEALALRDTLMTWPSLTLRIELLPWHWRPIPRLWTDWDCTSSCSIEWLFLKAEWFANRPLFSIERMPK